jgi:hypothetical protein
MHTGRAEYRDLQVQTPKSLHLDADKQEECHRAFKYLPAKALRRDQQASFGRYPCLVGNPGPMVDPARCDEEKIRQAVEVNDHQPVDLV